MVVCAKEANTAPAPTEGSWFSSPNSAQEVEHQGEVEHRGFVDNQDVERQRVVGIKLRLHLRRAQFQQAVDGLAFECREVPLEAV